MKTYRMILTALAALFFTSGAYSFCGFYVAKADASLFNEKSQVILVRDGNRTVITMSNDYQGDLKEFAMVIPVPEVLKKSQIRIAKQLIFDKLDAYSAPRMAEYYDPNPCQQIYLDAVETSVMASEEMKMAPSRQSKKREKDLGVSIEAEYTVGEYDILILSAKESTGLKTWLTENGYKIPEQAEEVLEPYIKNDLKFFVAKVNLDKQKATGSQTLRPIQFAVETDKFMLPIRLGMANSKGNQDLIVYAFTRNGRVETANYRTVKIPTDNNIPVFCQNNFGEFYKAAFDRAWKKENGKAVMLEYAWDLSSTNQVKCDPCVAPALPYQDLREAGVYWLEKNQNRWNTQGQYKGELFVTRLHVRYNRKDYPQDLLFTQTPNKQRFQGRYVIHHPAGTNLDCDEAQSYYKGVVKRRQAELKELAKLTGWNPSKYTDYVNEYAKLIKKEENKWIDVDSFDDTGDLQEDDQPVKAETDSSIIDEGMAVIKEWVDSLEEDDGLAAASVVTPSGSDPVKDEKQSQALWIVLAFGTATLGIALALKRREKTRSFS